VVAEPLESASLASVKSGVPEQVLFEYKLNVTVPVGLSPPLTDA